MAGHSKWANIKHKKAREDAKKGKIWSKCARAIIVAAKEGGGDPETNLSLRYAIDEAKSANMPKDTIENAIKKGTGELQAESYERMVYEGYGPNGVAFIVDTLTDNKNRTAPQMKKIFEKYGGNLGTSGCVSYGFQSRGEVLVSKEAADEETVMAAALEGGAEDVADADDSWQVLCDPSDYQAVKEAIEEADLPIEKSGVTMLPNTTVLCEGRDAEKVLELYEALEDHDDVQKIYANFDVPDETLAAME
ncbi:MAG: YebC/PmpR family DNA-binding transcriptional regulator [Phycisphaeraceae bacterium]|nr:YebC/PmpR family DNA-binding transcriptional regulator [Phycisphaeraceae bacterium]